MDAIENPAEDSKQRTCFVVAPFGRTGSEARHSQQVLKHLVRKVLEPKYKVVRADEIDDEGLITQQIIEHLLRDDIVIADLTGGNPNVFYEIAIRHAAKRPIVHLIRQDEKPPFDVADMRTIGFALDDPDAVEEAQEEIKRKVAAIEESDYVASPNPFSSALQVISMVTSPDPETKEQGEILRKLSQIGDEMQVMARRVDDLAATRRVPSQLRKKCEILLESRDEMTAEDAANALGIPLHIARVTLDSLASDPKSKVTKNGGGYIFLPF